MVVIMPTLAKAQQPHNPLVDQMTAIHIGIGFVGKEPTDMRVKKPFEWAMWITFAIRMGMFFGRLSIETLPQTIVGNICVSGGVCKRMIVSTYIGENSSMKLFRLIKHKTEAE